MVFAFIAILAAVLTVVAGPSAGFDFNKGSYFRIWSAVPRMSV